MKLRDILLLLLVIIIGATIANLIALKIAADQVQSQLSTNSTYSGLLGLLGSSKN